MLQALQLELLCPRMLLDLESKLKCLPVSGPSC